MIFVTGRGVELQVWKYTWGSISITSLFVFLDMTVHITREKGTSASSLPLSLLPSQRGITKPLTNLSPFYFL